MIVKRTILCFQLITFLLISLINLGAQPTVDFSMSDSAGCSPLQVAFTNNSTGTGTITYSWEFGDGQTSTVQDPVITYSFHDTNYHSVDTLFTVKLTVTDDNGTNFITKTVHVQDADASFKVYYADNLSSDGYDFGWDCYSSDFIFRNWDPKRIVDTGTWDFGYNLVLSSYDTVKNYHYPKPGNYTATLNLQTSLGCLDTATRNLVITGPSGTFSISKPEVCPNEQLALSVDSLNNADAFDWTLDDGPQTYYYNDMDTVLYSYKSTGSKHPVLTLYQASCAISVGQDLTVRNVSASFTFNDTAFCDGYPMYFTNTSVGTNSNNWNFGDGVNSTVENPQHTYSSGNYTVTLIVGSAEGCSDTTRTSFEMRPIPKLGLIGDTIVCDGNSIQLFASGGDAVKWTPSDSLDNPDSYTPIATIHGTRVYTATVSDTAGNCNVSGSVRVFVQPHPNIGAIALSDTTVGVGEFVPVRLDSNVAYSYHWMPEDNLNCPSCASVVARPLTTTQYTLVVSDTNNCFNEQFPFTINVNEDYHIVLPSSFTPNGDKVNDIIYVKGWGIDKLIEFRVYNRWGNEVFATDDLSQGWDGTKDGKPLATDSYAYTVKALMLDGKVLVKRGTFNLLR